ncbi:hypothetical protein MPSI1_003684 [Malassezia psittaci]|uniref:Uncharacterized protein n=1 Tax=Malassezia psittaci TaxID=1821823 RepID=A0AAF0FIA9_9BASI|nr:hypothetical protein MPSI1_003684 [Malassezia psittaci]
MTDTASKPSYDLQDYTEDDAQLIALGHKPELSRNFSYLSMLGLAFANLDSWSTLSISIPLAIQSGGPTAIIWGLVTAGIGNICLAMSLAEFLSAYPTAAGQYHWVAFASPPQWRRFLAWITGWITASGWVTLCSSGGLLGSQLITGLIALMHPDYDPPRWHTFLFYLAYSFLGFIINTFATLYLPMTNKASFYWSLAGITTIAVVILATAAPDFADAKWVFGGFINNTGWPNGLAWLLGLLQGSFGLCAYDGVAHMIEEIPQPSVKGPRVMVMSVWVGVASGLFILISLLFASGGAKNASDVTNSTQTPLIRIFSIATKSNAGSICLTVIPLVCEVVATTGNFTVSSRMTYALARDGGLPFSKSLSHVHKGLMLPLNSLILSASGVTVFGLIFIASDSAFDAITSAAVILLNLSYGIPIFVSCATRRSRLPPRSYDLGPTLGWSVNIIGIAYVVLTTVLFLFPSEIPTSGSSMNYSIVAVSIVMILSLGYWFVHGQRHFKGPQIEALYNEIRDNQVDELLSRADNSVVDVDALKNGKDDHDRK